MRDEYDAVELSQDATLFAESRFGAHYLKKLEATRERHLKSTQDESLTDSQRAHAGSKAAAVSDEIAYFDTARAVATDPKMIDRIRQSLSKRKERQSNDV